MAAKKKVSKKKTAKKKVAKKKTAAKKPAQNNLAFGKKIQAFLKLKNKISALTKQANDLKSQASTMEKELVVEFEKTKTTRADVKEGSVTLKQSDVFSASDWGHVNKYIEETGDFNLYQRRLNQSLLKEYFEEGKQIKGIDHMTKKTLSVGRKRSV